MAGGDFEVISGTGGSFTVVNSISTNVILVTSDCGTEYELRLVFDDPIEEMRARFSELSKDFFEDREVPTLKKTGDEIIAALM